MTHDASSAPPMAPGDLALISQSFARALQKKALLATRVYERFFELEPETRALFADDLSTQRSKITWALSYTMRAMSSVEELERLAEVLALTHARFDLEEPQFEHMAEAIIDALGDCLGSGFTPRMRAAWRTAFDTFLPLFKSAQARLQAA